MKHQKTISYEILSLESLERDEQDLLEKAMLATENAYAPYSEFFVGCAVALQNGEIFLGNNQENRAYPSGLCAERSVLYYVGTQGKGNQVKTIAIRARCKNVPVVKPITPCGACCQTMVEYEEQSSNEIVVLMMGETGKVLRIVGVRINLLPFHFDITF